MSNVILDEKNITLNENNNDVVKQLKDLNELYEAGVLSKEEFEKVKKKLLN